jgi:transposase-like protein
MEAMERGASASALARFADELSAYEYLETLLWPAGPVCPRCGAHGRVGRLDGASTKIGTYKCYACRRSFPLTFGTIFSSSHVPLHKWLQAVYLTDGGHRRVLPLHLQRILNVSFKTASKMMQKLETAARSGEEKTPGRSVDIFNARGEQRPNTATSEYTLPLDG